MTTNPTVSIVMPCFNASATLAASIGSLLAQTFTEWELVAVDDGSTDDTAARLATFGDSRIRVLSQANAGVSAARNHGLANARAPYVAFLDADDTWAPSFLEVMLASLEPHLQAALAYCGWQNLGLAPARCQPYVPPDYEAAPDKLELLLQGCPWPIHAALIRREALQQSTGFDERLVVAEDFLLWLELAAAHPIVHVPSVLAFYHHDPTRAQATADRSRAARQIYLAQSIYLQRHPEIAARLGRKRVRELTLGPMLRQAYERFWARDLRSAQSLFRHVLRHGYGSLQDWKYIVPAAMPAPVYALLVQLLGRR